MRNYRSLNRFMFSRFLIALCLLTFALPLYSQELSPEEHHSNMRARQAEMMEAQFLMQKLMMLGRDPELQKELEIVDDQMENVKNLSEEYQKEMVDSMKANADFSIKLQQLAKDGKHEEARKMAAEYHERQKSLTTKYMDKVSNTLLPHQVKRLKQVATQQRVKSMNQFQDEFGASLSLAKELGLTKDEKNKLMATIEKARKTYYKEVDAAKQKANEAIMNALTPEQRKKMHDILGDSYDWAQMSRRSRAETLKKQRDDAQRMKELKRKLQENKNE